MNIETAWTILRAIAPGSVVLSIDLLPGSYSNFTHLIEARAADGSVFRIVARCYADFGDYDRREKAVREFKSFELLQKHDLPAPRPLLLDKEGTILGSPGIVTSYVPGKQIDSPANGLEWAQALGKVLARIHAVVCDVEARRFLLDANSEVTWFLNAGAVPEYMNAHPDGQTVWQMVCDLLADIEPVPPTLIHVDYWSGNVLWDQGKITAVVDWEEAAFGDPGIDVAYCRMDMFLSGMGHVADEFLKAYEAERDRRVDNLGFWELVAAARPMFNPEGWISESPAKERFSRFIANARKRVGCYEA